MPEITIYILFCLFDIRFIFEPIIQNISKNKRMHSTFFHHQSVGFKFYRQQKMVYILKTM